METDTTKETSFELSPAMSALRHVASRDLSRANLGGVRFEPAGKRAIATDGHILASVPLELTASTSGLVDPFTVMRDDVAMLAKAGTPKAPPILFANGSGMARALGAKGDVTVARDSESTFPEFDGKIIPEHSTEGCTILGVNLFLLEQLCKVFKAAGHTIVRMQIPNPGESDGGQVATPVRIDGLGEAEGVLAVIMPCRVAG